MFPRNTNKPANKEQQDTRANTGAEENIREAHEQAEEDIQQDADLSIHSPNDDLDEGETARLGDDKTDLI